MAWDVRLVDEVHDWYMALDTDAADQVAGAIDQLQQDGPKLRRPTVGHIKSVVPNMRELRSGTVRILFVFDPERRAVLLVGGDKAKRWQEWYDVNIPVAEERYQRWLDGDYDTERT